MLGEVRRVATEEGGHVVGEKVDSPADFLFLAGIQAADPEVGVQAARDALEEFLVGLPGGGEDERVVAAEATDQAIAGDQPC